MRWALRTVALWAIAKGLEMTNARLKRWQRDKRLREQAANAAALPRTLTQPRELSRPWDSPPF